MTLHEPSGKLMKVVSVRDFRFTGKKLGRGNFARVEEAVHTTLNVKVSCNSNYYLLGVDEFYRNIQTL